MKEVEYDFVVSKVDGTPVTEAEADKFMDDIIELVEGRGWCLGGGYGECKVDEDE